MSETKRFDEKAKDWDANPVRIEKLSRICVFCGSSPGLRPEYGQSARELGACLAARGIDVVYGGAGIGLMGDLANAALEGGGKVEGVIPESIVDKVGHGRLTELRIVPTMHDRKQLMYDLSDAFIALPGGTGTLEEVFEIITWAQLGFHTKPCGLINSCGYFDYLLRFMEHAVEQRFVKRSHLDMLLVGNNGEELLEKFTRYLPPSTEKWYETGTDA